MSERRTNTGERPAITERVTQGARRWLAADGRAALREFTLADGLRADLIALGRDGEVWILEVKSGRADLQADAKWPGYAAWCDRFFFAVDLAFSLETLPSEAGVFRADGHDAELVRAAPAHPLAAARRRALTLRFARAAAERLHRLEVPGLTALEDPSSAIGSPGPSSS